MAAGGVTPAAARFTASTPSSQTPFLIENGRFYKKWVPNWVRKTPPAALTKNGRKTFAARGVFRTQFGLHFL